MNKFRSMLGKGQPEAPVPVANLPATVPVEAAIANRPPGDDHHLAVDTASTRQGSLDKKSDDMNEKKDVEEKIEYASGLSLFAIMFGLCAGVLLVAVDQTIVATAIPKITNQFHATDDIGWYASAYFLTAAALTAIWGKVYQNFSIKYWFLATLGLFELGSLICAVAPSSTTLIVGRAVAGMGVSGIFSGALIIIAYETPIEKRAAYIGMTGGVYGMSSIVGPLLGGAFTERVSWRWCFYINLPIGALTALCVLLFVKVRRNKTETSVRERISRLDLPGLVVFIPTIVCLLLAIQWGGTTYAWDDSKIIGLFIGAGLFAILFVAMQLWRKDKAMLPPRILSNRYVWSCSIFAFCFTSNFFILTYYIPIYFQSVKGSTAIHSAVQLLPFMISVIISSVGSGIAVSKFGRFTPFLIAGIIPVIIGTGLITTWRVDTGHAKWIGYQVLMGLGTGSSFQIPLTAVQSALSLDDVPTGSACVSFAITLGGAIGVGVAQSLFINSLSKNLAKSVMSISVNDILQAGATGFRGIVPAEEIPLVVEAYMHGITAAFRVALVTSCFCLLVVIWVPFAGTVKRPEEAQESIVAAAA